MKIYYPYAIVNSWRFLGYKMLNHIQEIIEAVSNSYGDEYLSKIIPAMSKIIGADYTFIASINSQARSCRTEVLVANGKIVENFEYALADTPCSDVADNSVCFYPKDICNFYPKDQLLIDMEIQAYLGTPLVDSKQNVIGIIVALYKSERSNISETKALFQLFSGRIAAELERLSYEQSLEDTIEARTKELTETINLLQATQSQLVESEKMSALGNLVAGVSHEVNTPLGIAITTQSIMADELATLKSKLDNKTLSMKDMQAFCQKTDSAINMQGENLNRAKNLIENFKKTAAEQHLLEIETLNIGQYYQRVTSTLRSLLKPQKVSLEIKCEDKIVLATYPGIHAQILTNLISNSIKHGFSNQSKQQNIITIEVKKTDIGEVEIIYKDNGCGLSDAAKQHIFEPFFTTARKDGGIGLGMSIVYNLITQKLNGTIEVKPAEVGACFHYKFKEELITQ